MSPRLPVVLLLLAACGSTEKKKEVEDEQPPKKPAPTRSELPDGRIYRTSRESNFEEMLEELAEADVVYIGETHTNRDHHRAQLLLIEHLHSRGRLHAIGMEMFQRPYQKVLDDYVFGRIGEEALIERSDYKKRWGYPFELYRPILEFAREYRIPVRALNVRDEIREPARKGGIDAVPEDLRRTLPAIDTEHYPEHKAFLRTVYDDHEEFIEEPGDADFENFYLVQCMWEDVMADSIVQWFRTAPDDGQIVVLAGASHVAHRYGIPARAHHRNGKDYRVVVPLVAGEEGPEASVFAHSYADWVWVTRPSGKKNEE